MDKSFDRSVDSWRVDPRATHDDPLLECLVEITRVHGVPATAQALSAGLPLVDHRLTPALLPRAAARARLSARAGQAHGGGYPDGYPAGDPAAARRTRLPAAEKRAKANT